MAGTAAPAVTQEETVFQAPVASIASLPPPKLPPLASGVVLTINVTPGRTPLLYGETNLPEGTKLSGGAGEGPCPDDQSIIGEGLRGLNAVVQGGRWSAHFDTDPPLRDGTWEVYVLMMSADEQPAAVQAVIGENAKNLKTGGVVSRKDSPIPDVEAKRRITFGNPATAAAATRARCPKD